MRLFKQVYRPQKFWTIAVKAVLIGLLFFVWFSALVQVTYELKGAEGWQVVEQKLNTVTYRYEQTSQYATEFSQLYHHDKDGNKVDAKWYRDGELFRNGYNHFDAMVSSENISVWNNKVNGSWVAKPFIKNKEIKLEGISIHVDRLNPNYINNVLYYDYGQFRREVRLIEGMIFSTWVFDKEPDGDISINITKSGNIKFRKPVAYDKNHELIEIEKVKDSERVEKADLIGKEYPIYIGDSPETFIPDAHPESETVDGVLLMQDGDSVGTWAQIQGGAGSHSWDDQTQNYSVKIVSSSVSNMWYYMAHSIYLFDTTGLIGNITITQGIFSLNCYAKLNNSAGWVPAYNIYSSSPASDTALVPGDYDSLGSDNFSDTSIAHSDINDSGWNDWILNTAGINAINTGGVTKLGTRESVYEVANNEPGWENNKEMAFFCYFAEKGTGFEPKLVVYYYTRIPKPPYDFSVTDAGLETVSLNWTSGNYTTNTYIRGIRGLNFPENRADGILVYDDTGESVNITGLSLDLSTYSLRAWGWNELGYSENSTVVQLGGDIVELAIEFPTGIYVLFAGFFLVFISFFLKKALIYLAIIPCMVGVLIEPAFKDLWFQSGCVLVMIWAAIAFYKKMSEGESG